MSIALKRNLFLFFFLIDWNLFFFLICFWHVEAKWFFFSFHGCFRSLILVLEWACNWKEIIFFSLDWLFSKKIYNFYDNESDGDIAESLANLKLISGFIDDRMSNYESDNKDVYLPSDDWWWRWYYNIGDDTIISTKINLNKF